MPLALRVCTPVTASAFSFFVSAREVRGNSQTQFTGGSNFASLKNGRTVEAQGALAGNILTARGTVVGFDALRVNAEVEVDGGVRSEGAILARKITLEDDGDEGREVELSGTISGLSAVDACPSITFGLPGGSIFTTSATEFGDVRCSALTNGRCVEVKGFRESNGTIRARRVRFRQMSS